MKKPKIEILNTIKLQDNETGQQKSDYLYFFFFYGELLWS